MKNARFPRGDSALKDQGIRASRSVALNLSEGKARGGGAERNHYRIALGSAAETCATLDLIDLPGADEKQRKLRRIGAMLAKMAR